MEKTVNLILSLLVVSPVLNFINICFIIYVLSVSDYMIAINISELFLSFISIFVISWFIYNIKYDPHKNSIEFNKLLDFYRVIRVLIFIYIYWGIGIFLITLSISNVNDWKNFNFLIIRIMNILLIFYDIFCIIFLTIIINNIIKFITAGSILNESKNNKIQKMI